MMRYIGDCTAETAETIRDMREHAHPISRRTFRKYVLPAELALIESRLGYERYPSQGLTMAGDFHVAYFASRYNGRPCVYFVWSAFEHIFAA